MDATDTERLLLAERAAEWLVTLEVADVEKHAEFRSWLFESPLHMREALVATATRLVLSHLFHKGAFDPQMLAARAEHVDEIRTDLRELHIADVEPPPDAA